MALKQKPLRGILLMSIAIATFAVMDTIAKYLSQTYPVGNVVWARYAINLLVLSAFMVARGEVARVKTARPMTQVVRGLMLGASTLLYFTSLTHLPLAEAASIGFVLPVFVAILAVPMLGERMDMARIIAIIVGLSGALIVVRPGTALFTVFALLPVGMALCNAFYQILTRKIAGLEHPLTSLFYGSLIGTAMSTLLLSAGVSMPQGWFHWMLFLTLGVLATIGHFVLIRAFDYAPANLLAPFVYSQLVWVMLFGWLVFGDFPDGWSLVGMAIVVGSGLYIANRQRLTAKR
jgi:drug/metabolite transporter (DMT)-like permease